MMPKWRTQLILPFVVVVLTLLVISDLNTLLTLYAFSTEENWTICHLLISHYDMRDKVKS